MLNNIIKYILTLLALTILDFAPLYASSSVGHEAADIFSLKLHFINFSIYAFLIFLLAKKNLPQAWTARKKNLEESISSSREKIDALEREYAQIQTKLSNLDFDIKKIKDNISQELSREIEEIKISTEQAIQRIQKQVKDSISAEERSFEKNMRKIYTEAALKLAQEKIKAEVNADSDKKLRDKTLINLQSLMN